MPPAHPEATTHPEATAHPAPVRSVARALLLIIVGAGVALAAVVWVIHWSGHVWKPGGDLSVYRTAAAAVTTGVSPYDVDWHGWSFVYPPFAALVLTPLAWVGATVGYWVWTIASVLAVPATLRLIARHLGSGAAGWTGRPHLLLGLGALAALSLSPIAGTLLLGNVNLLLLPLILVDLLRIRGRSQGVLLGVAAGIKLTPLIFVPYLLLTGRIRAALTACLSFLGTVGVGFLLLPDASATYWGGAFLDSSRTRPPGEEAYGSSLRGIFLNFLPPLASGWLIASVLAAVAGLAVAVSASRRGDELVGVLACAVTGLLVAPVTWYAHWVWCLPVLALLLARVPRRPVGAARVPRGPARAARRGRLLIAGLWFVFTLPLPWWIVYVLGRVPVTERAWMAPVELLYALTGAGLLVLAAVRAHSTPASPPAPPDTRRPPASPPAPPSTSRAPISPPAPPSTTGGR